MASCFSAIRHYRFNQSRERICSGWWDGQTVRRDYYFAETASIKLWIFRDLDSGSWHLHGIF